MHPQQYDTAGDDEQGTSYLYDGSDRIVRITGPDGTVLQEQAYDSAGNIRTRLVVDNPFWIDIQTGEIKYTDHEACLNPDEDAVIVASSFKNFCKCIKKKPTYEYDNK